ncbi:ParB/RepB/Spo0J family partition protein [Sapientia aquatica]|uniref:ParB/RepB/Spo0J family partition protein n=1 Tax=Sapientia aquatica TaxID=1549640 RepID=A0A4R5VMQ8_9BURK|nr:ParB/RepB/Spo0J family partition protein [Sapientia aquatica]TDK59214.1 ParB/RepB/Spo0J family partition protein [Sapientia aquatica]
MSIYDKLGAKTASIKARVVEKPVERPIKTAPSAHWDATERMHLAEQKVSELEAELNKAINSAHSKIKLSDLLEIEGRRRKLTADEFKELKNNLEKHPLVTPITVRSVADGKYEIISGHNRVAVYRELGRSEIPAVVNDFDEIKSELGALFANLFHPSLPDVQKYAHFKRLKEVTGKSQRELAEESGADPSAIARFMSFERLPAEALALIYENPEKIGATAAAAFALISEKEYKQAAVIQAVKDIIAGDITQEVGVRQAKEAGDNVFVAAEPRRVVTPIKAGKFKYCKVLSTDQTIRIDFESKEERDLIEKTVMDIIKKRSIELSNKP